MFEGIKRYMDSDFHLGYNGKWVKVSEHHLGKDRVFRIVFDEQVQPLVITSTKGPEGSFWTSIPEGRQSEAEALGALIVEYFKKRK